MALRIGVFRSLGGLGDLLTAVPALRGIRNAFPEADVLLFAPATLQPVVDLAGLDVQIVDSPSAEIRPVQGPLDVGINLHGRGPESHRVLLEARPARLVAFRNDVVPESAKGPAWIEGEYEVKRWCRLLRSFGIQADPADIDVDVTAPRDRNLTVIHPGTNLMVRRWPADRWAAVAMGELVKGRRVLISGSKSEQELASEVASMAGLGHSAVIAGHTDISGIAHRLAGAGRLLSSDTGVAHLAFAVGTPTVTLYGPVSPQEWGPPPQRPQHLTLWKGRTGDRNAPEPDPGLLEITTEEVQSAVAQLDDIVGPQPERHLQNVDS